MKTVLQAVAQYWKKLDKPLLFAAMLCSALSVVLLYSIYINHTLSEIDDDDYIIQLVAVGIGVLSVLVLAAIDYHKIARLWFVYAPIALIFGIADIYIPRLSTSPERMTKHGYNWVA